MPPKISPAQLQHEKQREALLEHSTRPHLSPSERAAQYSRQRRDEYTERAARTVEQAEAEKRKPSADERRAVDDLLHSAEVWQGRLSDHSASVEQQRARIEVRREPVTYRPASQGGEHSLFVDLWHSRMGDARAAERVERHRKESAYEARRLQRERESQQRGQEQTLGVGYETRVTPSRVVGQGGNFSPPTYLIEQFAEYPRPARVFSDLCVNMALPDGTQSINVPRLTTGTAEQTVADPSPQPDTDITDTLVSSQVVTITGMQDVGLQLLEQSGSGAAHLDELLFRDLSIAFDARLESEVTTGSGTGKELLGYLNITGTGSVSTSEPATIKQFKALGETFASVTNNRKLPPEAFLMRGGRWAFITTSEDADERPIWTPLAVDNDAETVVNPIGVLLGLPVYLTESIPTTLGASKEQEAIVCARPSDSYLWTSAPVMNVHEGVLSGSLEARLELRAYCAFTANRFPQSVAVLGGTGMKVTTGF